MTGFLLCSNMSNRVGDNQYNFKHPFGNVVLGENHHVVDTFQTSYLLVGLGICGISVIISAIIVILAGNYYSTEITAHSFFRFFGKSPTIRRFSDFPCFCSQKSTKILLQRANNPVDLPRTCAFTGGIWQHFRTAGNALRYDGDLISHN